MVKRHHPDKPAKRRTGESSDDRKPPAIDKTARVENSPNKRRLDILKGQVTLPPEFSDPLPEEELADWEG